MRQLLCGCTRPGCK